MLSRRPPARSRPGAPPFLTLRVIAWRLRGVRWVALTALAAALLARAAAPPPAPTAPVVVAARDVAAGEVLAAADLALRPLRPGDVPAGAPVGPAALDALVGRVAAVALPAGLPLVGSLLAEDGRFALDPPPGTVVVGVELASPGLLRAGDRVDLVAADLGSADPVVLAQGAVVLDTGGPAGTGGDEPAATSPLLGTDPGQAAASAVVLAVAPDEGRRIAAVWDGTPLGAVLVARSGVAGAPADDGPGETP